MTAEKNTYARKAITRASILAKNNANQMERDLIEASVVRYPRNWTDEMARDKQKRRPTYQAFADSMEKIYEKYPNNNDIATVYAVALFMLEERRGYRDVNNPDLIRLHNVLTKVLDDDISHPGACHLYIHATESSQRPDLALNCADILSDAVPVASHIQHMPSHTFNRTGHWAKAVVSGQKAQQSDLQALKNKGFSYGDTHNLHMLLYAASYDGQSAAATQAGKDYRKLTDNYENKDFPVQYAPYEILTLIRFGRFDEVLQKTNKPKNDFASALWDFAKGYASLKAGDKKTAADMHKQVLESADRLDGSFRGDSHQTLLNTVAYILEGEMHIAEGDLNSAIRSFEEAVKFENALGYSEPEPLPFSARHWLGAALYSNGQYQEAEQVYKDELHHHPHNGWSLYGLQQSLAAQGLNDEDINKDLKESWARSNLWITSSRF
jgi:tetratricopeptide (TPR) repeat protein